MTGHAIARVLLALVLLAGCATATGRIENGMFYSAKGYRVTLPSTGWAVDAGQRADLALRAEARAGGMVVDATCSGRESTRPARRARAASDLRAHPARRAGERHGHAWAVARRPTRWSAAWRKGGRSRWRPW